MPWYTYVGAAVVVVAVAIIIGIRIYKSHKAGQKINFDTFIDMYGDQIINVLKDVIVLLQIDINKFASKEEYEKAIISTTIEKLKENAEELGIDPQIIGLFDTKALTEIVYSVFNGNIVKVFSVLSSDTIKENSKMYEDKVVIALGK